MKSSSAQLVQEARPLVWPWALTLLAGIFALAYPPSHIPVDAPLVQRIWQQLSEFIQQLSELILPIGAFFAIPLIATMTIGNEFQHRTLSLRLSQPVSRQSLWLQKIAIEFIAVVPLAILYCFALNLRFGRAFLLVALIWILLTTAGAIPFTLIARSTMGGLVLGSWIYIAVAQAWVHFENYGAFSVRTLCGIAVAVVAYAVTMLWLGRRMLLRYQSVEGTYGESFAPGARLVPAFIAEWFLCRPGQPIRNLLRREVRLLRTLWPLSVLSILAWILVVTLGLLPRGEAQSTNTAAAAFGLTVIFSMLVAHLAGTLSLGEEKVMGTHEGQLTLPVSPTLQWVLKLGFALVSGTIMAALVPMAILFLGGWMRGNPELYIDGALLWEWPLAMLAITLVSFFCACIGNSAVRATMWFFALVFAAALLTALLTTAFSMWAETFVWSHRRMAEWMASRLDPVTTMRLFRRIHDADLSALTLSVAALGLPCVAVLVQSWRECRSQASDSLRHALRAAFPVLITLSFVIVVPHVFNIFWRTEYALNMSLFEEIHTAIEENVASTKLPIGTSRRISPDELAAVHPFSPYIARWLGNSQIEVTAQPLSEAAPQIGQLSKLWMFEHGPHGGTPIPYSANLRTENGKHSCVITFAAAERYSKELGVLHAVCDGQ